MSKLARFRVIYLTGCVLALWLIGHPADGQPTSRPATTSTTSAPAESLDPAVERILDRLEKKAVQDIQADLVYVKYDPVLDDKQEYKGVLVFIQDKPNPRFLIHFKQLVHEGMLIKKQQWHGFDGRWYIEARESTSQVIKREIVRPGEVFDAFKVGKGPFPLPFGQNKADIVRHFHVKRVPSVQGDPPRTDHLECTPLPGSEMQRKYGKVHFYIAQDLDVPVKVKTVEKGEGVEISATFSQIKINKGLARSRVNLPDLPGYDVRVEELPSEPVPPTGKP